MKKTIITLLLIAAAVTLTAQEWQYCEVTAFTTGSKLKTVANMDTITPPAGILNTDVQKWQTNTAWLNLMGSDGWELVTAVSFTAAAGNMPVRYTFKRKLKQ